MNKEFIPYEQALELKELGFDEPCFGCYDEKYYTNSKEDTWNCSAPLYQQAFRWFREKYGLHNYVYKNVAGADFWGYYTWKTGGTSPYNSYEEAELACLEKLIEIVKGGDNV